MFPKIVGKPPKWMVYNIYNGQTPIKMDDLGGKNHPYFWFNTHMQDTMQDTCLNSLGDPVFTILLLQLPPFTAMGFATCGCFQK